VQLGRYGTEDDATDTGKNRYAVDEAPPLDVQGRVDRLIMIRLGCFCGSLGLICGRNVIRALKANQG